MMRRVRLCPPALVLPFALLVTGASPVNAQYVEGASLPTASLARQLSSAIENQVALDLGWVSLGLSYARALGSGPWSLGAGLWAAWEPASTFEGNVWEPIAIVAFGRYRPREWLHADLGLMGARYLWADDCSDCAGSLVGLQSTVLLGYRHFFVGPEAFVGRADDERSGHRFGVLWGLRGRVLLGWN